MLIGLSEHNLESENKSLRFFWLVVALLVLLSSVRMAGTRAKDSKHDDHESMMLSANDRSRWAMIYAMVEHGTFSIDQVIKEDRRWNTIDKVVHRGVDGELHQYSSCLLYTSPSPRDRTRSRMPSSA